MSAPDTQLQLPGQQCSRMLLNFYVTWQGAHAIDETRFDSFTNARLRRGPDYSLGSLETGVIQVS